MFFHSSVALNKLAHEWLGLVFVVGGLFHLFSHYRSFIKYISTPKSALMIAVFIIILILSFFPLKSQPQNPARLVMKSVSNAPISTVIHLSGKSPEEILQKLSANGFLVNNLETNTIEIISNKDPKRSREAISLIFGE